VSSFIGATIKGPQITFPCRQSLSVRRQTIGLPQHRWLACWVCYGRIRVNHVGMTYDSWLLRAGCGSAVVVFVSHYCNQWLDRFADFTGRMQQVRHVRCVRFTCHCSTTHTQAFTHTRHVRLRSKSVLHSAHVAQKNTAFALSRLLIWPAVSYAYINIWSSDVAYSPRDKGLGLKAP